jgi:hypothetical protein
MLNGFFRRRMQNFARWWQAPVTRRDRVIGAIIGGMGCFWIGLLGRLALGATPVPLSTLGGWALGAMLVGILLGVCFPKSVSVLCFPFSSFGGGS